MSFFADNAGAFFPGNGNGSASGSPNSPPGNSNGLDGVSSLISGVNNNLVVENVPQQQRIIQSYQVSLDQPGRPEKIDEKTPIS